MEQCKPSGAKALYLETAQDPSPVIQAIKNTGWNPSYLWYSVQFYGPQGVAGCRAAKTFPPSYIQFPALPFELADQYTVVQQTAGHRQGGRARREAHRVHALRDERLDPLGQVGHGVRG